MSTRTQQQNKGYWVWLGELADQCVYHGIDMKGTIKVPIMATPELLHINVVHRLIEQMFGKKSTTELTTTEMSQVADTVRKIFAERTEGLVDVPFPDGAIKDYEQYVKNNQAIRDF